MRSFVLIAALLGASVSAVQAADGAAVQVPRVVPFSDDAAIAGAVRRECQLGEKLSGFIDEYAREKGVAVSLQPEVKADAAGRVLVLQISDAAAEGNAFLGHHTHTTVKGRLYQDGKEIGNFVGRRNSMGGAFAGFKGNCSVLGRTVKVLGQDIAQWLQQPGQGSQLGDLQ